MRFKRSYNNFRNRSRVIVKKVYAKSKSGITKQNKKLLIYAGVAVIAYLNKDKIQAAFKKMQAPKA